MRASFNLAIFILKSGMSLGNLSFKAVASCRSPLVCAVIVPTCPGQGLAVSWHPSLTFKPKFSCSGSEGVYRDGDVYVYVYVYMYMGMGSSWDPARVCDQVGALKHCRVPQFMQTPDCEVSWVLLSCLEHLAHAGLHTATTILSVVPESVR